MLHVFFYFHSESVLYLDFGFASQYESVNQHSRRKTSSALYKESRKGRSGHGEGWNFIHGIECQINTGWRLIQEKRCTVGVKDARRFGCHFQMPI